MGSIKNLFRKKSNGSVPDPESSSQLSSAEGARSNEARSVTDYRSFSEERRNRSAPPSRRVNLRQSDETLLEDQRNLNSNTYRGFSTSMHDMFTAPEFERVDCCATVWCGCLQSDRDRYLIQGIKPPSIARRFWLHIFLPFGLFALASAAAMSIPVPNINRIFCSSVILMLFTYVGLQCYKGHSKRIEIRKDLLWTKSELQRDRGQSLAVLLEQQPPDDMGLDQEYYLGQTKRDFGCAHPCCIVSFYAEDRAAYEINPNAEVPAEQQSVAMRRQSAIDMRRRNASFSRRIFDSVCPAIWCGHQMQCCGICALAQEGREIESAVLPASYRRIDYISMQPISHYYPAIYKQRHGNPTRREAPSGDGEGIEQTSRFILSDLSRQLLQFALTISILVFVWCLAGKEFWKNALHLNVPAWRIFDWTDFLVYAAAWIQAIVLTVILAWLCNRPCPTQLSLDAMIKYFAAGFCLSTSLAIFWELFLGMATKAIINLFMAIFGVNVVVDDDGYSTSWMVLPSSFARCLSVDIGDGSDFLRRFGADHPVFYTIYLAFASFVLAALVEETCKYFSFRMVEHPDFMSQREVEDAMTVIIQQGEDDDEGEGSDERRDDERRRQQHELDEIDFSKQKKSCQSLGGAVTLAMVCVAMGFTCCENLVYIFVYSGGAIGTEISILIARSFFPIHPIAAAIQSLYVVEREVEVTRTANLSKILLTSVFFHGSYDFALLLIDFLAHRNGNNHVDDDEMDLAGLFAFVVSGTIMLLGIVYYLIMARKQRARLQVTDAGVASGQSTLI